MKLKIISLAVGIIVLIGIISSFLFFRTSKIETCNTILAKYNANHACILTNQGTMVFELYGDAAPKSIEALKNFSNEKKFYDGLEFYRVIKDFVLQGGIQDFSVRNRDSNDISAPLRDKLAMYQQNIETESNFSKLGLTEEESTSLKEEGFVSNETLNSRKFEYGSLTFFNSSKPNTNTSEIVVVLSKDPASKDIAYLNGRFTNMGKIVSGQDVLAKFNNSELDLKYVYAQDKPINTIKILEVRVK